MENCYEAWLYHQLKDGANKEWKGFMCVVRFHLHDCNYSCRKLLSSEKHFTMYYLETRFFKLIIYSTGKKMYAAG